MQHMAHVHAIRLFSATLLALRFGLMATGAFCEQPDLGEKVVLLLNVRFPFTFSKISLKIRPVHEVSVFAKAIAIGIVLYLNPTYTKSSMWTTFG